MLNSSVQGEVLVEKIRVSTMAMTVNWATVAARRPSAKSSTPNAKVWLGHRHRAAEVVVDCYEEERQMETRVDRQEGVIGSTF